MKTAERRQHGPAGNQERLQEVVDGADDDAECEQDDGLHVGALEQPASTTAGAQTSAVPPKGTTDSTAPSTPNTTGAGRPTTAKAIPSRRPWMMAVSTVPRTTARVTAARRVGEFLAAIRFERHEAGAAPWRSRARRG